MVLGCWQTLTGITLGASPAEGEGGCGTAAAALTGFTPEELCTEAARAGLVARAELLDASSGFAGVCAVGLGWEDFPRRSPSGASLGPCRGPWLACGCITLGHLAPSGCITRGVIKAVVTSIASPAPGAILFRLRCLILR